VADGVSMPAHRPWQGDAPLDAPAPHA
jgi:hypothetical protein